MKILLINKFYFLKGGAEKQFFDVKKLLEDHGHQVIVFSMQHEKNLPSPYSKYFVSKVDFEHVRFDWQGLRTAARMFYSIEARRKLDQLIHDHKPDVAHIHNIYHHISPSILPLLKKHRIPIVQTLHDYKLICPHYSLYSHGEICERSKGHNYWRCAIHKCVKNSLLASTLTALEMYFHKMTHIYEDNVDVFISPSKFLMDKLREWEAPVIEMIHMKNFFQANPSSPAINGEYLLFYGRLSEEKGIDLLLDAVKGLDIPVKIAGSGPDETVLREKARRENISNVEFLGFVEGENLQRLIVNSGAVIVPSQWYENCPLVILEAFAYGKPVLGTRVGGIPELIEDGKTGMLFDLGDVAGMREAIQSVMSDKVLRQRMGEASRNEAQKYLPEKYYSKLVSLYESLQSHNF
ncbi:MAG: glycosyltransferase [bacterium]|nr:glycosyltransferase [bacterium]